MNQKPLRELFDTNAENYDKFRPGYPDEVFDTIIRKSNLSEDAKILEIGCGTGQASKYFAKLGFDLTCLEMGPNLSQITKEKLSSFPNASVQNIAFEDFEMSTEPFDLIISATAFHWIPREISYSKCSDLLKRTGYLAIFRNFHPKISAKFFDLEQQLYSEVVSDWPNPDEDPPVEDKIALELEYFANSTLFEEIEVNRFHWSRNYRTSDYIGLIGTYSNHLKILMPQRSELFRRLSNLIDTQFDGNLTKPYITGLYMAQKRST